MIDRITPRSRRPEAGGSAPAGHHEGDDAEDAPRRLLRWRWVLGVLLLAVLLLAVLLLGVGVLVAVAVSRYRRLLLPPGRSLGRRWWWWWVTG
ncbi:MAG TPA: hypothetical protein VK988_11550 [Acidimicrobiales bacterium]|nr:hypothetical protein [Acidimicrobiales bacterium]